MYIFRAGCPYNEAVGILGEKSCVALLEEGDRLKARVVLGGMSSKLSIPSLQLRP